jgi:hypothetical protein
MRVEPPQELDGAKVLKYAVVSSEVRPTGATRHERDGAVLPAASALAVAKYDSEPEGSYYLFYLDPNGRVMTDTWHESVERALDQAAFEYQDLSWQNVSG